MPKVAEFPNPSPPSSEATDDSRAREFARAIEVMLAPLPLAERETVVRTLAEAIRPQAGSKAGDVLGVILRLLPNRPDWTVEDLKKGVGAHGVKATDKQIFNAVGYLTRKGRIKRVGYGRYVVEGVELVTTDDFGGERSRTEQMDPN